MTKQRWIGVGLALVMLLGVSATVKMGFAVRSQVGTQQEKHATDEEARDLILAGIEEQAQKLSMRSPRPSIVTVMIGGLRSRFKKQIDRTTFDKALIDLSENGRITLIEYPFLPTTSKRERDQMLLVGKKFYFAVQAKGEK